VPSFGLIDPDYQTRLRTVASGDADGPVYMLTLARFRPGSGQVLGWASARDPGSRYVPIPLLTAVGASLCLVADVVAGAGGWDRVGFMRYPTRRAFVTLSDRSEMKDWNATKERRTERVIMLGVVPVAGLPADPAQRALLEVWHGPTPPLMATGAVTEFDVEGTYMGDGRQWSGARYTAIELGTALPLRPARFGYLAVLVEPVIERWM
jgi:hypothetical protein